MTANSLDPAGANASRHSIVMTTIDSEAAADDLAARIVEARLAACVQIVPVRSVYLWRGHVRREGEWLLLVKLGAGRFDDVERFIRANHSYETPEVVRVPITGGSADYLRWLDEAVSG